MCLQWEPVQYFNNKIICDLVEEKFKGIISILVRRDAVLSSAAGDIKQCFDFKSGLIKLILGVHFCQNIKHTKGKKLNN